ncbi:hypothetical protein BGZ63DRAFT_400257 [Mariannaea sp. PMI_226]|nr:hypothetical protein BGZ63DRAFT_400257 [Mariannaea sp. PMI_226]
MAIEEDTPLIVTEDAQSLNDSKLTEATKKDLVYELYRNMMSFFDDDQIEEAVNMAGQLLLEPALAGELKAAVHYFLACHGQVELVENCLAAVNIYSSLLREDVPEEAVRYRLQMLRTGALKTLAEIREAEKRSKARRANKNCNQEKASAGQARQERTIKPKEPVSSSGMRSS